jgi:hypothetical protein
MTMAGTITWSSESTMVVLQVTTASPLVMDADCGTVQPISGEVRLSVVSGADPGYLAVSFDGCSYDFDLEWVPED